MSNPQPFLSGDQSWQAARSQSIDRRKRHRENPPNVVIYDLTTTEAIDEHVRWVIDRNRNLELLGPDLASTDCPVTPLAVEGSEGKLP